MKEPARRIPCTKVQRQPHLFSLPSTGKKSTQELTGLSYKDVNSVASFLLTEKWITIDIINKVSICEKEN